MSVEQPELTPCEWCGAGSSVSVALRSNRGLVARACVECANRLDDQPHPPPARPKPEHPRLFDSGTGMGRRRNRGWWEP